MRLTEVCMFVVLVVLWKVRQFIKHLIDSDLSHEGLLWHMEAYQ